MTRKFSFGLFVLLLQGCVLFSSGKSTSVPFQLLNNHILINATVNGDNKVLIFDSSALRTALIQRSQASQNLTVQIDNLLLSQVDWDAINLESNPGFPDVDSHYFDGSIGHDLLNKYIVEINYDTQLITFISPDRFIREFAERQNNWESVPIVFIDKQPAISMPITLGENAKYLDFTINTGSNLDLKLPKGTLDKELTPEYSYTFTHFDWTGKYQYQVYPLDRTYLGDHPKIWPLVHTPVNDTDVRHQQHGMIGNAILSRFNLIIDLVGKTLYFQENQRHSIKNFPDRSGLTIGPHKSGAIVTSVTRPASGLLQPGDIIQAYEGIDITESTYDGFRLMLSSEAEKLNIWWLRDGQQYNGYIELQYRM